jgi:hypothetical protein
VDPFLEREREDERERGWMAERIDGGEQQRIY